MCSVDGSAIEDMYLCSPLQEGLMSLTTKRAGDYIMQDVLELRADVDEHAFRAAWEYVVQSIAVLRTRIVQHSELGLLQVVVEEKMQWTESESLEEYLREDKAVSMGVGDRLARYALIKEPYDGGKRWFVWTMHHALYDGWSLPWILHAVKQVYSGAVLERQPSFNTFIQYLSQQDPEAAAAYWQTALVDCKAALFPPLPSTVTQPVADTIVEYQCPPPSQSATDITTSTLARAAWAIVTSRYTSSDDVVFGATVTGRNAPIAGVEAMVGPTIATVPLRVCLQKDQTVSTLLECLQQQATEMIAHEQTGLQRIIKMGPGPQHACSFQTLLVVQPADNVLGSDDMLGEWRGHSELQDFTTYALIVQCTLAAEGVHITASFDARVVEEWVVEKMLRQFGFVMQQLAEAGEEKKVADIETTTPEDRQQLQDTQQCSSTAEEVPAFSLLGEDVDTAKVRKEIAALCSVDASLIEDVYPCSPLQEGLMSLTAKRAGDYIMQSALELRAEVDEDALRAAWEHIVQSTAALRTRIVQHSELGLLQVVMVEDTHWIEAEGLEEHLMRDKAVSMGLGDPLTRYALVKEPSGGKRWFVWTIHHAVYDGWSLPRILHAVKQVYSGVALERQPSFNAFIQYLGQQNQKDVTSYWQSALVDFEATLFPPLPSSVKQPVADTMAEYQCPPFTRCTTDMTMSTLIRAAWALVASRYTSSDDVVFGTTVTGRNAPVAGIEAMVGPTIATVPLRVHVQKDQVVSTLLECLQQQGTGMIAYEQTGLQHIAKMGPGPQHACGFQTLLVVQPADDVLRSDDTLGEWCGHSKLQNFTTYALMVQCTLAAEGVHITASFDARVIEQWVVEKMLRQFSFIMQQLAEAGAEKTVSVWRDPVNNAFDLTPIQHLYLTLDPSGRSSFDQCFFLELRNRVQPQLLVTALTALVQRHSMLRARFQRQTGGRWQQYISEHDSSSLIVNHIHTRDTTEIVEALRQSRGSLDIERGPVLAAVLCDAGERQSLFVAIHHLVVDLVSWRILLEELEDLLLGQTLPPALSTPFQAWHAAQAKYIEEHVPPSAVAQVELDPDQLSYWGVSPDDVLSSYAISEEFVLDRKTTSTLLGSCNDAFSTRPLELMVAALSYSFATIFSDRKPAAIFNEIHGREAWDSSIDLTRTVGWFTSMCPVQAANGAGLLDAIRETKDCIRSFQDNGWSYFASQFASASAADAFASLFPMEVLFNYQGLYQQLERKDSLFKNLPMPDSCEPALAALCPRFALFDVSFVVEQGCAKWIQKYKVTLIDMSALLPNRSAEWTLSDLPLAFSSYIDLDRFRHKTLPGLEVPPEDVEDVFPCTPMQEGILTSQGKDPDAYWVCFIYEVIPNQETSISLARLQQAWKGVVHQHSLLRTLLVDNVPGSTGTTNVVLKDPQPSISVFSSEGTATIELFRSRYNPAAQRSIGQLQHHLSICQLNNGKVYLCLDINHAIIDAHSRALHFAILLLI
ncbi:hypothetical protein PTNB73_10125 [Pyrenophora teres f. teres]|nr:hypothetical protein PTNB73_10125 [Pyrenophora teres f. teres]